MKWSGFFIKKVILGRYFLFVLATVILAGCASTGIFYQNLNTFIRRERYDEAQKLLESDPAAKNFYTSSKNELLYWLDKGFLAHLSGEYQQSNFAFERAKRISEELFTKSISAEASTFLISDNMRPYAGEDFEIVLIHIFSSLNYVMLGDYEGALVELRQADAFLRKLELYYDGKTSYKEDAFARYLAGLIYETAGEINDAHVSYLRALDAYRNYYEKSYSVKAPKEVVYDAIRTANMLGLVTRAEELARSYNLSQDETKDYFLKRSSNKKIQNEGEVIVLIYAGLSPYKIDDFFEISFGRAWFYVGSVQVPEDELGDVERANRIARSIAAEEQIVMAFPKYVSSEYRARTFMVSVSSASGGGGQSESGILFSIQPSLAEDIGAIAVKSLDERIGRIRIKTIARSAVKYALSKKVSADVARSSGDKALGWLTQKILAIAATATELADKRSWRTLPDKIFIARITGLKVDGEYNLRVDFKDEFGDVIATRYIKNVSFNNSRRKFIILRSAI